MTTSKTTTNIMGEHDKTKRRRRDVTCKLRSGDIRSWCEEWDIHPDLRNWFLEAYARGLDERAIITFLNRSAAAQLTRMRNLRHLQRRRRIEWNPNRPSPPGSHS